MQGAGPIRGRPGGISNRPVHNDNPKEAKGPTMWLDAEFTGGRGRNSRGKTPKIERKPAMLIELDWKRIAETVWTAEQDGRHVRVKQEGTVFRWTVYYPVEGSATGTAASVRAAKQAAIRAL